MRHAIIDALVALARIVVKGVPQTVYSGYTRRRLSLLRLPAQYRKVQAMLEVELLLANLPVHRKSFIFDSHLSGNTSMRDRAVCRVVSQGHTQ